MIRTARRNWIHAIVWLALAIASLGGLYAVLQSSLGAHDTIAPRGLTYTLFISSGQPENTLPVFGAHEGDTVSLIVSSTRDAELHVHGYEKSIGISPAGTVSLTFVARYAGSFPIHVHERNGTMLQVAVLEVQPR